VTLDPSFTSEGASYRQLSSRQVIAGGSVLSMRTCNTGYLVRRRRSGNITTRVVCCVTQSTITLGSQGRAKNPITFCEHNVAIFQHGAAFETEWDFPGGSVKTSCHQEEKRRQKCHYCK
jgi:hypothetical protein